eukprot:sb/3464289/
MSKEEEILLRSPSASSMDEVMDTASHNGDTAAKPTSITASGSTPGTNLGPSGTNLGPSGTNLGPAESNVEPVASTSASYPEALSEIINNHCLAPILKTILNFMAKGWAKLSDSEIIHCLKEVESELIVGRLDLTPFSNLIYAILETPSPTIKSILWMYHRELLISSFLKVLQPQSIQNQNQAPPPPPPSPRHHRESPPPPPPPPRSPRETSGKRRQTPSSTTESTSSDTTRTSSSGSSKRQRSYRDSTIREENQSTSSVLKSYVNRPMDKMGYTDPVEFVKNLRSDLKSMPKPSPRSDGPNYKIRVPSEISDVTESSIIKNEFKPFYEWGETYSYHRINPQFIPQSWADRLGKKVIKVFQKELSQPINCQDDVIKMLKRVRQSAFIIERDFIRHESLSPLIGEVTQLHNNQNQHVNFAEIKDAIRGIVIRRSKYLREACDWVARRQRLAPPTSGKEYQTLLSFVWRSSYPLLHINLEG